MSIVVVAEKPAVARDIARVVGASERHGGYLSGNGYVVTWAIGHLVRLAQPDEIKGEWKAWRREQLPMFPGQWPLVVIEETRSQFDVVAALLNARDVQYVVCATDAGREGELIFRFIREAARCTRPVKRLWISSLTEGAIRAGMNKLQDASAYDGLADAARGRAQADWLVGMNLSRLYTLAHNDKLSVGRVQTPTLALIVARDQEIRNFVPRDYLEVVAEFAAGEAAYKGTWFRSASGPLGERKKLLPDGVEATAIVERVRRVGFGLISSRKDETQRMPPPLMYDLTELQRHANRLFGFSADHTLKLAQSLYESKKLLSYPRTDSRHLSTDVASTLADVVAAIGNRYPQVSAEGPLAKRFVDDSKVGDHHAIIPTTLNPRGIVLSRDEERLYDLVCRRLLGAWLPDHVWSTTTIVTNVEADQFHSVGNAVIDVGWKALEVQSKKPRADEDLPDGLVEGGSHAVNDVRSLKKQTQPPKPLTDATLLSAMETAGRLLDDKELSLAMKECGLGTPATRASMIETLITREYVVRAEKTLRATDKGIALIANVHPDVASPSMTGQWEARLHAVSRGDFQLATFMQGIEAYIRQVIGHGPENPQNPLNPVPQNPVPFGTPNGTGFATAPHATRPKPTSPSSPSSSAPAPAPAPAPKPRTLTQALAVFGHTAFRPQQEAVCCAVEQGNDALLVMPTGAGKSLCYQLPGLVRGGTTLVLSPLIALIEDQVTKLKRINLRAERIHSGRTREQSRAACVAYLAGDLDYLFIAPERLGVPGFLDMLARRKPTLIAVDEAHCISHWGHDFRPDYRMLGARLAQLRPAPVMALTATATPQVQDDIVTQLGLQSSQRFIHGFRRDNIAIEVVTVPRPQRMQVLSDLLRDPARKPAIVYAPSRDDAETLAALIATHSRAAAYHAGMSTAVREQAQTAFLDGALDVIVATIAFGMGVDKANIRTVAHLALPQSLEGYYQEIGRAGRDGQPARALLLHSYVDRKRHEFFRDKSYPDASLLRKLFTKLRTEGEPRADLAARARMKTQDFECVLEKLWIHGGATITSDVVTKGRDGWLHGYEAQRAHRMLQEEQIAAFAETRGCRMVRIVQHFGDVEDARLSCGKCDVCSPSACLVQQARLPTANEQGLLQRLLAAVAARPRITVGILHREAFGDLDRDDLEGLVAGLSRAQMLDVADDVFTKDGKKIAFQRLSLSEKGQRAQQSGPIAAQIPVAFVAPVSTKKGRGTRKRFAKKRRARSTRRVGSA